MKKPKRFLWHRTDDEVQASVCISGEEDIQREFSVYCIAVTFNAAIVVAVLFHVKLVTFWYVNWLISMIYEGLKR